MAEFVKTQFRNGVLEIVLARPKVNAMNIGLAENLRDAFREAGQNDEVAVVVMRGDGRGFCAGADLRENRHVTGSASLARHAITSEMFDAIYRCRAAVICSLHGYAIGAGLGMAALADIRIASADTFISMPEVRWGVSVGGGASKMLRLGMSTGRIREIMLTGERIPVSDARVSDLIDYVVPEAVLQAQVDAVCGRILDSPKEAVWAIKEAMNVAEGYQDWSEGYKATHELSAKLVESVDVSRQLSAFFGD